MEYHRGDAGQNNHITNSTDQDVGIFDEEGKVIENENDLKEEEIPKLDSPDNPRFKLESNMATKHSIAKPVEKTDPRNSPLGTHLNLY